MMRLGSSAVVLRSLSLMSLLVNVLWTVVVVVLLSVMSALGLSAVTVRCSALGMSGQFLVLPMDRLF